MAAGERIEVTVGQRDVERLNWMMEVGGIDTREDLVAAAMGIMEWAVRERMAGRTVASFGTGADDAPQPIPRLLGRLDAPVA